MLENLDKLDWANIHHSHGKANKFPEWIRALASPSAKTRRATMENIWEYSNHQTSRYPVTAYVIPFIIELLQYEEVRDKSILLAYLNSVSRVHREEARFSYEDPADYVKSKSDEERNDHWGKVFGETHEVSVKRAHEAATEGVEVFLQLLDHPKIKVRKGALSLLGEFPEQRAKILPRLSKFLLISSDPFFKAKSILIMAARAEPDVAYLDFFKVYLQPGEDKRVRVAAAIALTALVGEHAPREAVDLVLEYVQNPELVWKNYEGFYNVISFALRALCNLGPNWTSIIAPPLLGVSEREKSWCCFYYAEALIHITFEGKRIEPTLNPLNLTDLQRATLSQIANSTELWESYHGLSTRRLLNHFGLPSHRAQLREFLAQYRLPGF